MMNVRKVSGFTLIELLVVVAIISILASILFPVFARARENARRASCMSNMKQLALGVMMYVQDYDGRLPFYYTALPTEGHSSSWTRVLPYLKNKNIFRCPSSKLTGGNPISATNVPANGTHYGMPAQNPATVAWRGKTIMTTAAYAPQIDSIPNPATIQCLFAEVVRASGSNLGKTGMDRFRAASLTNTGLSGIVPGFGNNATTSKSRHFDGNNYAFLDGHVKWLKKEAVRVPHGQNKAIKFHWYN